MDNEIPNDLNVTLLKRDYFLNYIKRATCLEGKTRRIKSQMSSDLADRVLAELKTFFQDLHIDFIKCNSILELFLRGVEQIQQTINLIRPIILRSQNEGVAITSRKSSNPLTAASVGSDGLTSVSNATSLALKYVLEANTQCLNSTSELVKVIEQGPSSSKYSENDITTLSQNTHDFVEKLSADVLQLKKLCADARNDTEIAKTYINDHKWKEHELVKGHIVEAKKKIRELKNETDSSTLKCEESEALRDTLNDYQDEMKEAKMKEKDSKYENLQKALKESKLFYRGFKEQFTKTASTLDALKQASKAVQSVDPSGEWRILRVPAKHQTLCCLLRGPVEVMTHLKMSYRKRNHLRLSILTLSEKLISDIIDIDNLNNSKAVKWPLLVCIPQRSAVEREQEKNVIVKWTNDQQNRNWMSERPLAVNKDYSDRILSLKGVFFTEVKIMSFCTLAVVMSHQFGEPVDCSPLSPAAIKPRIDIEAMFLNKMREREAMFTDIFVFELVSHFQDDWKKILIHLGVPINFIKNAEMDNPISKVDVMLTCFSHWKQTTCSTNKAEQLREALKKCDRHDLVAMVTEQETISKNSSGQSSTHEH